MAALDRKGACLAQRRACRETAGADPLNRNHSKIRSRKLKRALLRPRYDSGERAPTGRRQLAERGPAVARASDNLFCNTLACGMVPAARSFFANPIQRDVHVGERT